MYTKILQGRTLCPWAEVLGYGVLPDDFLFRKDKKSRDCGSYLVSNSITYAYNIYHIILVSSYIKTIEVVITLLALNWIENALSSFVGDDYSRFCS